MNYIRTTDRTFVPEGAPVSETPLAKLWRWPTQFLPDAAASLAPVLPVAVWGLAAFLIWKKVKTKF
jgi:hypothetical protein